MSVSKTVAAGALAMMLGTGSLVAAAQSDPVPDRGNEQEPARAEQDREREEARRQQAEDRRQREDDRRQQTEDRRQRADDRYEAAQDALENGQWTRAVQGFREAAAANPARADAATYWLAYAQSRLGQHADALATLSELMKTYPSSRWLGDARALEIEVRRNIGQPVRPEAEADEELKLLAIQGLQHSDPAQAVPMLQKFLQGSQSPKLKERALFVLAQSSSPEARAVITGIARGGSNPDLQRKAIQYLGMTGRAENRQVLAEIYAASSDTDVKRQILRAYMVSGDRARVLSAATSETAAGAARRSRAAARRDGRSRGAVAALSEGEHRRGQAADCSGAVRRWRRDAAD